ncbi:hypothetical protein IWW36_000225 [Coemansia brasiliensis]|uniref:Cation-transporting ATPase n=1 Tax=Coemansia brasiliensis TaxID=2650707 RepID=A0A9W8IHX8_9FUNG|nr:hypothetical protein IWW36_000225 [Coemansia brasiliensis]
MSEQTAHDLSSTTSRNAQQDKNTQQPLYHATADMAQNRGAVNSQYAAINAVPLLQERTAGPNSAAQDAAAVTTPTAISPILTHPQMNGAQTLPAQTLASADPDEPGEPQSRASLASSHSQPKEANLPFTYSGVFSNHVWQEDADSAFSDQQHQESLKMVPNNTAGNSHVNEAGPIISASTAGIRGTIPGRTAGLIPSGLHAAGLPFDDSDMSSSEDDDSDDSSESESYEGLAVDDINESYDHKLPEYVPNSDPLTQRIYLEEEGISIYVRGMSYSLIGFWAYRLIGVLTLGLVPLLCRWVPRWHIWWTMRPDNLGDAEFAVITDEFGAVSIEKIRRQWYGGTLESVFGSLTRKGPLYKHNDDVVRYLSMFTHRYYRFVFHPYLDRFLPNTCWMDSAWTRSPLSIRSGLSYSVQDLRQSIFGSNSMDIQEKSIGRLLVDEVLNPFYMFQVGSIILWCFDNYYYYASCILLISVSGIVETLVETRRNTRKIKEMAHFTCPVRLLRDGAWRDGKAEDLLPGDVFEVVPGMHILPCDAVLLEGDCIVNESMLTGESIPVAKVPVAPVVFGKMRLASSTFGSDIAKHVLFSGTRLVRVKKTSLGFGGSRWLDLEQRTGLGTPSRATAMVLRTGFNTTKGALVRSILIPRPNKFKFYEDSFRFIGVLAVIAVIGFLASIGNFLRLGLSAHIITVRALDLITVVVPPALPATMSIGVSFALSRLRKRYIYCISPTRINICGKINVMCFDKTGTLTEEGLDVLGVQTIDYDSCQFNELQEDPSALLADMEAAPSAPSSAFSSVGSSYAMGFAGGLADLDRSASMTAAPRRATDPSKLRVLHALATCHTVKQVDGELVGDPLDIKMLQSTGWILEESDDYAALPSTGGANTASHAMSSTGQRGGRPMMPVPAVVRPPNSERFTLEETNNANVYELGIIRAFDFSAALRRQSVVAKRLGARYNEVYVKGAPEAIRELCYSNTIPRDFDRTLLEYTNHGYRVIALAGKPLKMSWPKLQRLKRDAVEQDLVFMGFLVFENKLKPTTAPVLDELRGAKIRQIMCTGDNVLTAISVGRECGMIPEDMKVFVPRLIRRKETMPNPAMRPATTTPYNGANNYANSSLAGIGVRAMLVWEEIGDDMRILDPYTLEPRMATIPVKERLVTSDVAETPEEMEQQQQQYLTWLHNYTNLDMNLATNGKFCVAITGEVFRYMMDESPELTVGRMLMRGAIYARMSPDEKAELVEQLQEIGYCAGFCGDGANDCGALRAADVGLSLSEAEASVAAPFTSHSTDIQCVLEVIREGRAALVTSFSCFKYMALYSIIQFTSVSMLYEFGGGLGDFQFLYIDLFIIVPLAVFMGRTPAFTRIAPKRPTANLMSKKVLTSLFGQIAINSGIQAIIFRLVKHSDGYMPPVREDPTDLDSLLIRSFENTALFLASSFQYILVAVVFSIGPPYRQSNLRNVGLVVTCTLLVAFTMFVTLQPNRWCKDVFEMVNLSTSFRRTIVVWAIFNFSLSWVCESWAFPRLAPLAAKYGRIARYLLHRYIFRHSYSQYTQLATADANANSPANKRRSGNRSDHANSSSSATANNSDSEVASGALSACELEGGHREPTWEQISQKTNIKPFKRILRDMGIPSCLQELCGYDISRLGKLTYWMLVVCTLGGFYVLSLWFPHIYTWVAFKTAPLATAEFIVVYQDNKQIALERDPNWRCGKVTGISGLNETDVQQRKLLFGNCIIDIQEKSYIRLLWEEALNPLYVFQIASIAIWCSEEYYYYAAAILAISAISIASTVISTKKTAQRIREMSAYVCMVHVVRNGKWQEIISSELVPGDIIDVSANIDILPCDAVLIEGDCIVNESMLTGESVPETKQPLNSNTNLLQDIDMAAHTFQPATARHLLFAGTKVIRARKPAELYNRLQTNITGATAMVLRTGFCTTKGTLVRSLLFPHATKFQFYRDALRFVWVLAGIAMVGFIINTINLHRLGVSASEIALKALDLITIVVPPALPASMSIGMVFAAQRLRKMGISCISPSRINVASKVAVMLFDKTGTLTEEGLDMFGVHMASQHTHSFVDMQTSIEEVVQSTSVSDKDAIVDNVGISGLSTLCALATCHSLSMVDGVLVGDPLEVKMVEFTGWRLDENTSTTPHCAALTTTMHPPQDANLISSISIIKSFEFAPELCRASVVTLDLSKTMLSAFVKGAPEIVREICLPETIPSDFDYVLNQHTQNGYRVIALAGKLLDLSLDMVKFVTRAETECSLVFMGFVVFENRVKPESADALCELSNARIRAIMCTGDNPLTAVSVARECLLIEPETTVFIPQLTPTVLYKPQPPCLENGNIFASLNSITWKESTGKNIMLDPVTLLPKPTNNCDLEAKEQAQRIRATQSYCLAFTGSVFSYLERHASSTVTWKHMLMRGKVYARMSPEQKALLVDNLQQLGYIAGFCGDGANDCAALKTADVGLSLSEAEASVAAPFTSRITNISSVICLLKEGRCSIATSFACFKYMALYSIIQFTTCCFLYSYDSNLTNGQFLFIDLFTILPIAVCIDRFKPYKQLVPKRPSASLISKKVLTSLVGNILLIVGFQVAMFLMIKVQPWYQPPQPEIPDDLDSTPNITDLGTSLYLLSSFQYLFMGVVFSIGPPYRQSAFCNYVFIAVVVILLVFDLWVLLGPVPGLRTLFGLVDLQVKWRLVILGMAVANFLLCYLGERTVFPRIAPACAKLCRLLCLVSTGKMERLKGNVHVLEAPLINPRNGIEEVEPVTSSTKMGLWKYLNQRQDRKEYKLLEQAISHM